MKWRILLVFLMTFFFANLVSSHMTIDPTRLECVIKEPELCEFSPESFFYPDEKTQDLVVANCKTLDERAWPKNEDVYLSNNVRGDINGPISELRAGDTIIFYTESYKDGFGVQEWHYAGENKERCYQLAKSAGFEGTVEEIISMGEGKTVGEILESKKKEFESRNERSFAIGYVMEDIGEDDNYFPLFEIISSIIILAVIIALLVFGYNYYKKKQQTKNN